MEAQEGLLEGEIVIENPPLHSPRQEEFLSALNGAIENYNKSRTGNEESDKLFADRLTDILYSTFNEVAFNEVDKNVNVTFGYWSGRKFNLYKGEQQAKDRIRNRITGYVHGDDIDPEHDFVFPTNPFPSLSQQLLDQKK